MEESLGAAWMAQAPPYILANRLTAYRIREGAKGCLPDLAPHPVDLEPIYQPLGNARSAPAQEPAPPWENAPPVLPTQLLRLQVWVSPDQSCDWNRAEAMLKMLAPASHRLGLELVGNREQIQLLFLCHRDDYPLVRTAFRGFFEQCQLIPLRQWPLPTVSSNLWDSLVFADFFPPPPYSHLFTQPRGLNLSIFGPVMAAMMDIEPSALGLYQVLIQPVPPLHNWHLNVEELVDSEFRGKLLSGGQLAQRYAQQAPSGDLHHMAGDTVDKANNDKPFYAGALRVAVIGAGEPAETCLRSLCAFASLVQHGGRPLACLSHEAYRQHLPATALREMFILGQAYRPGFLLNSSELTTLAHIPHAQLAIDHKAPLAPLETLPPDPSLQSGMPVGVCPYAGEALPVCIPPGVQSEHTHILGATGQGKSLLMEQMVLHQIDQGHGMAVLDPHGLLIQRLLCLIPRRHAQRVVYMNPGDPQWVPIWNPLKSMAGYLRGCMAEGTVRAFRDFVTGWGDRLEHLLKQATLGVLHLPQPTLMDVYNLLRRKSTESERLRTEAAKLIEDEVPRSFLNEDFIKYSDTETTPGRHKLSKLLTSGTVSLMLSQPDSLFDLREIMDNQQVLLVDLSTNAGDAQDALGCFILSQLYLAAISRGGAAAAQGDLKPFHIFCDEAHRFITDAVDKLISETRKFNVSLTVAHQYLDQFPNSQADALSTMGSTVIFRVDQKNAAYLQKDLQGLVEAEDLTRLKKFQAIAKIGGNIVRSHTPEYHAPPEDNARESIIQQSRAKYYRPAEQVRREIRRRNDRFGQPFTPLTAEAAGAVPAKKLEYEEL